MENLHSFSKEAIGSYFVCCLKNKQPLRVSMCSVQHTSASAWGSLMPLRASEVPLGHARPTTPTQGFRRWLAKQALSHPTWRRLTPGCPLSCQGVCFCVHIIPSEEPSGDFHPKLRLTHPALTPSSPLVTWSLVKNYILCVPFNMHQYFKWETWVIYANFGHSLFIQCYWL